MNLIEYIRDSLINIRVNKLRSSLSLIGIIVGIMSVVVLIGLGNGMKQKMIKSFSSTNNIITVAKGRSMDMFAPPSLKNTPTPNSFEVTDAQRRIFTENMVMSLRSYQLPNIKAIIPVYDSPSTNMLYDGKQIYASILFASEEFFRARNLNVKSGSPITEIMKEKKRNVIIAGYATVNSIFEKSDPIGKKLSLGGQVYEVIGILEKTGDYQVDQAIFLPENFRKIFGAKNIQRIEVYVEDVTKMHETKGIIDGILGKYAPIDTKDVYNLQTNERFLAEINKQIAMLTLFIAGIAGISLFVGGIGIMNVMLVSVTERTREIGIRKAIGAKKRDIMTQFLIESGTITCIGGVIAIGLSYIVGYLIAKLIPQGAFAIDLSLVLYATGFSILMGVVFGLLPAWKGAKMNTIDALRYE